MTPPAGCHLVCVPPDKVALAWPSVRSPIFAAMKRGDLSSFGPVEDSVLRGDALLWLAIVRDDGSERANGQGGCVQAAAVTELHQTEWRKVCVVVACGGSNMGRWIGLIEKIEAYARAEGCEATRIIGRKGWARVLTSYQTKRIVLEKDL
jgi:hypothetical protein